LLINPVPEGKKHQASSIKHQASSIKQNSLLADELMKFKLISLIKQAPNVIRDLFLFVTHTSVCFINKDSR
jgi:hypothetical protein